MSDIVIENCNFKSWETLKNKYQWMQLIRAISLIWKQKIIVKKMLKNDVIQDYHLLKNTRVIVLDKLIKRDIYSVLLL